MISDTSGRGDGKPEIIITGGRGFIGGYLTSALLSKGYSVSHLSRKGGLRGNVKIYEWIPEKGKIEKSALAGNKIIVHLAGANLGSARWTKKRKRLIFSSRVDTAKFLYSVVSGEGLKPEAFISASGTSYYGSGTTEAIYTEESPPGNDFLAETCREWEAAAGLFATKGIRTTIIRTAPVLAKSGGGLSGLIRPARYGIVIRAGSGRQYIPWIHITDLCNIYIKAIEGEGMSGAYNAVSPHHTDHDGFMRTVAAVAGSPVFLPRLPGIIMRVLLGEMSSVILNGSRVSPDRIIRAGYSFLFPKLDKALSDIIR